MVRELFDSLLDELGGVLEIPDLHPDRNNSCLINYPDGYQVQIEMDPSGQAIIIGSDLGVVPVGRYRENLFKEALKANGMPGPLHGILAFSTKTEHLILFERIPTLHLTGDRMADALGPFNEKAQFWKEALTKGETPIIGTMHTSGGMFGLRP